MTPEEAVRVIKEGLTVTLLWGDGSVKAENVKPLGFSVAPVFMYREGSTKVETWRIDLARLEHSPRCAETIYTKNHLVDVAREYACTRESGHTGNHISVNGFEWGRINGK